MSLGLGSGIFIFFWHGERPGTSLPCARAQCAAEYRAVCSVGHFASAAGPGVSKMVCRPAGGIWILLAIELVQLATARGMFDVDDLFTNTLGTMVGWSIVMLI